MKKSRIGLCMVVVAGVVYGLTPGAVTLCYGRGATPALMAAVRYAVVTLLLLPRVLKQGNGLRQFSAHWKKLLLLSLVSAATPMLLFNAYTLLPTGLTTSLHFLYPGVVVLLCAVLYRDRPSKRKLFCLGLCLVGVLLIVDLSGGEKLSLLGLLLTLLSSVTWALYILWLDKMDLGDMTSDQLLCFEQAMSCLLVSLVYGPLTGTLPVRMPLGSWALVAGVCLFLGLFAVILFAFGIRLAGAQTAAIASTMEPITSMAVGILFLQEPFTVRSLLGTGCILLAVVLLAAEKEKPQT